MLHAHSGLRWLVLLLLAITAITAIIQWIGSTKWNKTIKLLALISLILCHVQLLTGIVLYFISPKVNFKLAGENSVIRFFTYEHSIIMILAIALVTIGHSLAKRRNGIAKVRSIALYYSLALALILYMIPW